MGDLSPSIFCCKVAWFRERFSLSSSTPCNLWPREELVLNSLEWESCCWPSPTPALRRAGPEPSLDSKLELTLLGWTQMSRSWEHNSSRANPTHPQMPCGGTGEGKMAPNLDSWANRTAGFRGMRTGELALPLTKYSTSVHAGELTRGHEAQKCPSSLLTTITLGELVGAVLECFLWWWQSESWQVDQPCSDPGPVLGPWVGPLQHTRHLWNVGTY